MQDKAQNRTIFLCTWVTRIAYLNLLWLFFSLVGLLVFGIMPATTALHAVLRKLLSGEECDIKPTFWSVYQSEWGRSNLVGGAFFLGFVFFATDTYFAFQDGSLLAQILVLPLSSLALYCLGCLLLSFSVLCHFDFNSIEAIRFTMALTIGKPAFSFSVLVAWIGTFWAVSHFWIVGLYISAVFPAIYTMNYFLEFFPKPNRA